MSAKKIGIIGSGAVGRSLGTGFIKSGYTVKIGSRTPDKKELTDWKNENGDAASLGTFEQAAAYGEILVLCTKGPGTFSAINLSGLKNFSGKVVIDTTNPIADALPVNGVLIYTTGTNDSLGEQIQKAIPDARVVKAFNSIGNVFMYKPSFKDGTPTMFFCGNDGEARKLVSDILVEFGWEPYDCGKIEASRAIEPLCQLWCLPGMLRNDWSPHAFKVLTK
jgi:8-hydroxy-5-deazaflavin:NADPH oxidoreductase